MKGGSQQKRALAATLAAVACLGFGCVSTGPRDAAGVDRAAQSFSSGRADSHVNLTAAEERRSRAVAHYASGVALELTDGIDAALPEYLQAFELDPVRTALAVRLAEIYLTRKEYAKASALLEISIKAAPNSPALWLWLGIVYRSADQTQKAVPALRQALKLDPRSLTAVRNLVDIYLQQGLSAEAVALLDHAYRQQSKDANYWTGLGDLYMIALKQKPSLANQLDRNRIRQCYERALALAPREPDLLLRLADVYLEASDYQKAADVYSKLLAQRPDSLQIRERLAYTYIQADQKDKAISVLEELIKRDPSHFETYNMLGDLYDDLDKDEKAIDSYQQSLVLNPNQLEVYVRIALSQLRLKKYDDALKTLEAAKEKFPTKYQVPYLYGLVYSDTKQFNKALASFADAEALAQESPDEPKLTSEFYFAYGSVCERAGDIDKAVPLFKKSIELDPENHAAYNYLGYMWADKGIHLDEALKMINKALAIDPNSGAYIDSLGWVLYKLGRYEDALPQLRRAVTLITDDPVVFDHLAEDLMKLGKRDEALHLWHRALQVEPGNKDIIEKLQKYTDNHTDMK
jgi:tetratricopeptide (TPR) repeat protein